MKKTAVLILGLWVILTLACNLSVNSPTTTSPGYQPSGSSTSEEQVATSGVVQGETLQPGAASPTQPPKKAQATQINSQPVSIKDGLASLNSYNLAITFKSSGPDPKDTTTINLIIQHSKDLDARLTHFITDATRADSTEPSHSESFIYNIGNDQCSGSGEDWSWSTIAANQKEMTDIIQNMISVTPTIENPTFVAQETINGIPSNHFSFKVAGLGVKSGAEVTANQGDYWLAVDGRYIVKYTLVIETRGGPNSEILHEEVAIDLTQINQPVDISFPQTCINAKNATPTPSQ